tara:strand:- start:1149 stop:1409 length:261 start_codon:yes stop_codon:yes gene_type:complete
MKYSEYKLMNVHEFAYSVFKLDLDNHASAECPMDSHCGKLIFDVAMQTILILNLSESNLFDPIIQTQIQTDLIDSMLGQFNIIYIG